MRRSYLVGGLVGSLLTAALTTMTPATADPTPPLLERRLNIDGHRVNPGAGAYRDGVLYVGGSTDGAFPGVENKGGLDSFVSKHDSSGKLLWARQWGDLKTDVVEDLAVLPGGGVVTVGSRGFPVGSRPQWYRDGEIRAYNVSGRYLWHKRLPAVTDSIDHVVVTGDSIYVTGVEYRRGASWPSADRDIFVHRYALKGGRLLWARAIRRDGGDRPEGLAVSGSRVYVGAHHSILRDGIYQRADAGVVVVDTATGKTRWSRRLGGAEDNWAGALAADRTGAYLVGTTWNRLPGQQQLGNSDLYVAAYSPTGKRRWIRQFGTDNGDHADAAQLTGHGLLVGAAEPHDLGQPNETRGIVTRFARGGRRAGTVYIGEDHFVMEEIAPTPSGFWVIGWDFSGEDDAILLKYPVSAVD